MGKILTCWWHRTSLGLSTALDVLLVESIGELVHQVDIQRRPPCLPMFSIEHLGRPSGKYRVLPDALRRVTPLH